MSKRHNLTFGDEVAAFVSALNELYCSHGRAARFAPARILSKMILGHGIYEQWKRGIDLGFLVERWLLVKNGFQICRKDPRYRCEILDIHRLKPGDPCESCPIVLNPVPGNEEVK
jgi:hypothetical protein